MAARPNRANPSMVLRRRPSGAGVKPPCAALAEDRRGERQGKGTRDVPGGDQEDVPENARRGVTSPGVAVEASLRNKVASKLGILRPSPGRAWRVPEYWTGGARRGGGVSLVCCSRMEREKAGVDTSDRSLGLVQPPGRREGACRGANRRHGVPMRCPPADQPVVAVEPLLAGVGVKRRGWLIRTVRSINRSVAPGGSEENMPTSQAKPFDIPKQQVWEAYRRVAGNKGAPGSG